MFLKHGQKGANIFEKYTPDFFIELLTQNVIFHVKSHVTKHAFWGLLILKSQHPM